MFSLIITIISIALVAALALATIYYGGSAFTKGGDAAKASQLINEGQQLQGANTLRGVQEPTATALVASADNAAIIASLSPAYLVQVPAGWTVGADAKSFVSSTVSDAVCAAVNAKATGVSTATSTKPTGFASLVYFCDATNVTYKF